MKDVTIIGGGLAGILAAIALCEKKCRIRIIERYETQLARGIAYSSPLPYQLLNVPAGKMSLNFTNDDDFVEWLFNKMKIEATTSAFYPRSVFANYITDQKQAKLENVTFISDNVINISSDNSKYIIHTTKENIETDIAIIATGNALPKPIIDTNLYRGIVIDDVNKINISQLLQQDKITIVGTGLTAVDVICSLHESDYRGQIIAISRRGLFPLPHKIEINTIPVKIDFLGNTDGTLSSVFAYIKQVIKANPNIAWQDIIDGMRPVLSRLWQLMSDKDKTVFLSRVKPYWEVIRHRMPYQSFEIIQAMIKSNQLQTFKGKIEASQNTNVVIKNTNTSYIIDTPVVINCTGANTDIATQQPFFMEMLYRGYWVQDKHKLGIEINEQNNPINSKGGLMKNMFVIGALCRARDYDSIALRELKIQALKIATLV